LSWHNNLQDGRVARQANRWRSQQGLRHRAR